MLENNYKYLHPLDVFQICLKNKLLQALRLTSIIATWKIKDFFNSPLLLRGLLLIVIISQLIFITYCRTFLEKI